MDAQSYYSIYQPSGSNTNGNGIRHNQPHTPQIHNARQLLATLLKCHQQEQSRRDPIRLTGTTSSSDYDEEDEDDNDSSIILLSPVNQFVQLEPRAQDVSSFNVNADLLCVFADSRNRWLDYKKTPTNPPQPLKLPRLVMSPSLCRLWLSRLYRQQQPNSNHNPNLNSNPNPQNNPTSPSAINFKFSLSPTRVRTSSSRPSSPLQSHHPHPHPHPQSQSQDHPQTHLLIIQGLSSTETRKFIAVDSIHEAASTLFNELANGYSVVFAGTMFKTEFDNRMRHGRAYQMCRSLDELRGWLVVVGPAPAPATADRGRDKDGFGTGAGSRVASGSSVSSWIGAAAARDKEKEKDRDRDRDREKDRDREREREREKEKEKEKKTKEGVTLVDESRRHLGIFC